MTNIIAELEKYSEKLVNSGLVVGAGGNLSMRDGEYMYISPSGYDLLEVKQESWVQVHIDTGKVLSKLKPSSEIEMHLECFRNNNYMSRFSSNDKKYFVYRLYYTYNKFACRSRC